MAEIEEVGVCPECGGTDLEYGAPEPKGEEVFYPFTCNDCGADGRQWYRLNFIKTTTEG